MASAEHQVVAPFDLAATQRVARAVGGVGGIDKAIHQVFVTPMGDAQAGGLEDVWHGGTHIFDEENLVIEAFRIPDRNLQAQGLAQQGLAGAELLRGARPTTGVRIVQQHLRQAGRAGDFIDPGIGGLDQYGIARAPGAEIQGVAAAGVVHIDVAAVQKQSLTLFCVAEGGVAAFFLAVIGFGFDNARGQPQIADFMADDFAQQFAGQKLGITVEKAVRQGFWQFCRGQNGHGWRRVMAEKVTQW